MGSTRAELESDVKYPRSGCLFPKFECHGSDALVGHAPEPCVMGSMVMFLSLRQEISIEAVSRDLRNLLAAASWRIEIGDGEWIEVDRLGRFEIVARSCHTYEYEIGFGDHYRVLVAVGGVRKVEHGVVQAHVCFASMFYRPDLTLITVDFWRDMP